jgi:hypothetical protein
MPQGRNARRGNSTLQSQAGEATGIVTLDSLEETLKLGKQGKVMKRGL